MSIIKWEPFGEIDRFFNDFPSQHFTKFGRDMAVDLYEEDDKLVAEMNVSGIEPEKIDINIQNGYLSISGAREEETEKNEKQFYSKEICRGSFERTLRLPQIVDEDTVEAEYDNGVLKILMSKADGKNKEKKKIIVKKK